MATLVEFVAVLLRSTVELLRVMLVDVALVDPVSFVVWATGVAIVTATMLVLSGLVAGMVGELLGLTGGRSGPPARSGG